MNTIIQNPLNPTAFEIPDPPEEFGQDGGKFYRAYDALAGEIDEDMTTSLKEQLDGMLIFAGLFAGVNTAFLALTIPLLSADPSDDTNALLNSILMQMATDQNSTVPGNSDLPSVGFSPSRNIFAINTLFGLSLAFAIISSFLAVLGRQWLVYYRKRSGGGPDRQRWEQLKRLLGAQRWRMELILDDVLPSLLQTGLIIFCISLVMYLHHLNPVISVIVGIPLYFGLAIFVVSALCTLWDRFCPFHSPLSHLLCWSAPHVPPMVEPANLAIAFCVGVLRKLGSQVVRKLKRRTRASRFSSALSETADEPSTGIDTTAPMGRSGPQDPASSALDKYWMRTLKQGRQEETLDFLQVTALRRAICTSDDPMTLLHATANVMGITNKAQLEQLWGGIDFRERLLNQLGDSYTRMVQLRSPRLVDTVASVRRVYCATVAHIALSLDFEWESDSMMANEIEKSREVAVLLPATELSDASIPLVQTTLGFSILQFYTYYPSEEIVKNFRDHFAMYSDTLECGDWRLLCIISWVASSLPRIRSIHYSSIAPLRLAYKGDIEHGVESVLKAFEVLIRPEYRKLADCDRILSNIVSCLNHCIMLVETSQSTKLTLERKFALLEACEGILNSPQLPEGAQHLRRIRSGVSKVWQQECAVAARWMISERLPDALEQYISKIRTFHLGGNGHHEYIDILRAFGPSIRQFTPHGYLNWKSGAEKKRFALIKTFNNFVQEVDQTSRQIQNNVRRVQDPDERWCHWKEPTKSIRATYTLPPDPPGSRWHRFAEENELLND